MHVAAKQAPNLSLKRSAKGRPPEEIAVNNRRSKQKVIQRTVGVIMTATAVGVARAHVPSEDVPIIVGLVVLAFALLLLLVVSLIGCAGVLWQLRTYKQGRSIGLRAAAALGCFLPWTVSRFVVHSAGDGPLMIVFFVGLFSPPFLVASLWYVFWRQLRAARKATAIANQRLNDRGDR